MPAADENATNTPGSRNPQPTSAPAVLPGGLRPSEKQYEFKPHENKVIGELAGRCTSSACFSLASGLLVIGIGIVVHHYGPIISGSFFCLVGLWTQRASIVAQERGLHGRPRHLPLDLRARGPPQVVLAPVLALDPGYGGRGSVPGARHLRRGEHQRTRMSRPETSITSDLRAWERVSPIRRPSRPAPRNVAWPPRRRPSAPHAGPRAQAHGDRRSWCRRGWRPGP